MKTTNVGIGVFVIGGLTLSGIGMFMIGDRHQAFASHAEYYSQFGNLAGLTKGAKVRVAGMDAGQVVSITVPQSPSTPFRVKWRIDAKLSGLVRTDSVATIATEGVVGDTYLAVGTGSPKAPQAAALATIPSKEPTELADILVRGNTLLADADGMIKQLGGKVSGTLDTVNATVSNVNDVVDGLKQGRGTAGMLLTDDKFAAQVRGDITSATSNIDQLLADVKAGRGPAGVLLRDEAVAGQLRQTVKNAQQVSQQADALMSDLQSRELPKKASDVMASLNDTAVKVNQVVSDLSKPDANGMSPGANIRETLTNANIATANLADDGEALKHNFLLRGFFKKRGYYNLASITPEVYRTNRLVTDPANHRVWLSASELFERGPKGEEELSDKGKQMLNASLEGNSDPTIVEGYSNGDVPVDQFRLSAVRAMQVREYLQAHFGFNLKNLGIVALQDSTPRGADRAKWDGVCIVLLKKT